MHRLLLRQIRRHLGVDRETLDAKWQILLATVDAYYEEVDQERILLENAMTLSSEELTNAIARARREHAMLRGVMDSIPDLMYFKTTDGRYLGCNKAFERYISRTEAEVIGKTDFDLMPADTAREVRSSEQEVVRTQTKQLTERWLDLPKSEGKVCLEVMTSPYFEVGGQLLGLISIARNITARKEAEETIYRQAHYDALTALPNRRYFYERLAYEIQRSHSTQRPIALMLIDLDRFKQVNDLLGHAAGDTLLVEAAHRLMQCVGDTDTVARLGGDEFTVVVSDLLNESQASEVARNILERMALPFTLGNEVASVSASIGIALYPGNAQDVDTLINNADQAMYVSKSHGRNRFSTFTDVLHEATLRRRRLTAEVRHAVAEGQMVVHYQPVVNLDTGKVHMAEALVRWQHPEEGLIAPADFLSLAEETGTLAEIGEFVFDDATRWLQGLRATMAPTFRVVINMSALQFRQRSNSVLDWLRRVTALGLPGDALALDINEDLLINLDEPLEKQLHALRAAGVGLALDDFGTGYTSLPLLQRLGVGTLKIDAERIAEAENDPQARQFCEAVIIMAHALGMKVIAEGVATEAQRDWLVASGCDQAQGYLWGKPLPARELEELLSS